MGASKAALAAGTLGSIGTAATLMKMASSLAWPASNLSGYIVAGRILGGGAATSARIAAIGGPVVAGALASLGVGALCAGLVYKILR